MAEFQEVMQKFDRMCWYYTRKRECPMGCPMNGVNISQCRKVAFEEPIVTEKTVMSWAAEHPDPVYPTWTEWLTDLGAIPKAISWDEPLVEAVYDAIQEHIPADIAQKLGIEPKEG